MGTCFFVTPFTADSAGGEDPELFETVQEAVRGAAEDAEVELRRADDIFAAGVVIEQVRGEIERADLVIAVCINAHLSGMVCTCPRLGPKIRLTGPRWLPQRWVDRTGMGEGAERKHRSREMEQLRHPLISHCS